MAAYYEVHIEAVQSCIKDNRDELCSDGLRKLGSKEIKALRDEALSGMASKDIPEKTTVLTIWTPRAALRLGMLLRDSPIAKAVRTEMLDIAESKPVHDVKTLLDASVVIINENERLQKEVQELRQVANNITEINYKLDLLLRAAQPKQPTQPAPRLAPVQQELDLDIVQRFNKSKADLLAAKTLENEAKAAQLTRKFAPKTKANLTPNDIAELIATNSVASWANERIVLNPTAKTYVGKADGNPDTHLYPNYVTYCKQHRLELVNMQRFSKVLMSLVEMALSVRLGKGKDNKGCHVKGVAIGECVNLLVGR